ncbi:hypothetical protein NCCP436_15990 [Pseudomonas sp. NCCP-436]|nr:hypothetical protein NCCP436_15990 [Pseudomonas sp. NCCP-436]
MGQTFFLRQLLHALGTNQGQLALQLIDPRLQQTVGLAQLAGHLVEQGESLFHTGTAGRIEGRRLAWLDGLEWTKVDCHRFLSHDTPSEYGRLREV